VLKLGKYKKDYLKVNEPGIFNYSGKNYYLDHILPKNLENLNILQPYNHDPDLLIMLPNEKWHRYFHHLNSSQAMCVNFFYPLIKEKKLDIILEMLKVSGKVNYLKTKFEKESSIESDPYRKTNFDFFIETEEI
jgi:hypothetical protein